MALKNITLLLIAILVSVSVVGAIGYSQVYEGRTTLVFNPYIVEELNTLYEETPKNMEFMGALELENELVKKFILVGYKNLDNNEIELLRSYGMNEASIHSHPDGLCAPSPQDRLAFEGKICLICGVNKISCFEN